MSMVWVTDPEGVTIETQFATPWAEEAIRTGLACGRWKNQAIWVLSKKRSGDLVAYVEYEGERFSVPIDNLPNIVRMQLLLEAY